MAGTRIQGKEYPVQDILCEKFVFSIPRYQRPYAWKIDQAETLLEDLKSALGDLDDDSDDIDAYFLGSVVVVKDENNPLAEVVDGQQRLTTLTILLAAIRALLSDPTERDNLTPFIYHKGNPLIKMPDHFHLSLRERDREFFQEFIQKDITLEKLQTLNTADLPDSQLNIILNTRRYLEVLSDLTQKQLKTLATYILTQCYLIIVSTPNVDSAYRIFSVLNDRGLDLSYTDICKAEVIGKLEDHLQDAYTRKWEDAEEVVGRDGFKEVFAHIRTIHKKAKLKETILKELRQFVLPNYPSKDFIDKVIVPYTTAYDVIRTACYQSDHLAEEINLVLKWLGRIDNFDWLPPAMMFYHLNKHAPDKLLKFLTDLERLAASMMIRRDNINIRLLRYGRMLEAISQGQDLFADGSQLQLKDEEKKLTVERLEGDIYNSGARIYILRRLDAELSETKTTPELPIYTVEHVLPQSPDAGSKWLTWYPDPEARKILTHQLGNLALLSRRKNSQAQNYEFDKKKSLYFNSPLTPFALTTQIIRRASWDIDTLADVQRRHVNILKKLWRLE